MSDTSARIVQKLWSYCNVLRDDGLSYQDYLEQLTFLLFLKMADERAALFVACYKPGERQKRRATWSEKNSEGRWRAFTYDDIVARDKVSLDLFWLRDESLEDSANLPDPNILAQEIADDLRSALGQIEDILGDLEQRLTATDPP